MLLRFQTLLVFLAQIIASLVYLQLYAFHVERGDFYIKILV